MKKTAFITGITGQDGSYLSELLLKKGYKVVGLVSKKHGIGEKNIAHIKKKLVLEEGDLLEKKSLERALLKHKPDEIYNLGAITFVPTSWENAELVFDVNCLGVLRILDIIKEELPRAHFLQATSSKIFGVLEQSPQNEATKIVPVEPYGVSKAGAHFLVQNFRERFNLFLVSLIMFNHESERRGEIFVTRKITQGVVKIKLGLQKELLLGNLKAKQDWGYAPDYVRAMWLALQQNKPQDFVIATGKLHTVEDVCRIAFSHLRLDYKKFVKIDKKFFRKQEARRIVGDASCARKVLGWQPTISFEEMIKKMVDYDYRKFKTLR